MTATRIRVLYRAHGAPTADDPFGTRWLDPTLSGAVPTDVDALAVEIDGSGAATLQAGPDAITRRGVPHGVQTGQWRHAGGVGRSERNTLFSQLQTLGNADPDQLVRTMAQVVYGAFASGTQRAAMLTSVRTILADTTGVAFAAATPATTGRMMFTMLVALLILMDERRSDGH